jgi:ABC-type sugar transport system substrate-binding protein
MQADPLVGRQIKDFVIHERVGRGGMAVVYRAFQPSMSRSVALKVIELTGESANPEFRQRFAQEAELIAGLEHLHILPVYDYGIVDDELAFLAMRLLTGGSLSSLIVSNPLDVSRAARLFTQIARGLAYAHRRGVIHRDIKPSNILLDDDSNAYLTDFGLAKMVGDSRDLTRSGTIVGTPAYMAPEQLRGDKSDHRADIYSLGTVLYHMLTGQPPFEDSSSNLVSVIYQQLEKKPRPPSELNPNITPEVEAVILNALSKDASERFDDAEVMAESLNIAAGNKLSTASLPAARATTGQFDAAEAGRPTRPIGGLAREAGALKRKYLIAGAVFAAVALAVVLGLALLSGADTPHKATVLADETGAAGDYVPTEEEVMLARRAVGSDGFLAYIACNQDSEYHATQAREMGDFAAAYGLDYQVYNSRNDPTRQVPLIETARADGASVLLICPLDIEVLDTTLQSAQAAGMPLVFLHSDIPSYGGVLLGGDDYLMGLKAGQLAGQIIRDEMGGEANVIILDYPSLPSIVVRANGGEDGVLEFAPDATIVGRYLGAIRENAEESVGQLITDGIEFDVIVSINDAGSYGAIDALEVADIPPDAVVITSVDAEAAAVGYIRNKHYLRGSVDVGREIFSHAAVDIAVKLLAGGTLPELILVPPGDIITVQSAPAEDE